MYFENEDIIGYRQESGKIMCSECYDKLNGEQKPKITQKDVVTVTDLEDGKYFCDSCECEIE